MFILEIILQTLKMSPKMDQSLEGKIQSRYDLI